MTIKLLISWLFLSACLNSQVSGIYKIDDLLSRIKQKDTAYVVNFWATWCKPCIEELPSFDSLTAITSKMPVKVLLVTLDFKEDLNTKVKPFLLKHKLKSQVVLLDETNGNDFINKISEKWSGAIPATYFKNDQNTLFVEKKMRLADLNEHLKKIRD
jgi:thiol-disulfide isomerase/thioredoxin